MNQQSHTSQRTELTGDGTRELLVGGLSILSVGLAALVLTAAVFGGINRDGAHSNTGWFFLVVGAMCVPFGLLLSLLGTAKWLRNRSLPHDRR